MGLAKQYLRYKPSGICNIIGSQASNIVYIDERRCLVGACENVHLWALRTREKISTFKGEKSPVNVVRYSAETKTVAIGYNDGTIAIFDIDAPDSPKFTLKGHKYGITCLNFSRDGLSLVSGSRDTIICLWDLVNESGLFRLMGHTAPITQCNFVHGRGILVSSSKDALVKFWDLNAQHCFYTIADHRGEVWDFVIKKNGTQLLTGSITNEIRIYNLKWLADDPDDTGKLETELDRNLARLAANSNDEDDSAANQSNNILRCNQFGVLFRHARHRVAQLCFSDDESMLMCLGVAETVDIYQVYSAEEIKKRIAKKLIKIKKGMGLDASDEMDTDEQLFAVRDDISTQYVYVGEYNAKAKIKNVAGRRVSDSELTLLVLTDRNCIKEITLTIDEKAHKAEFSKTVRSIQTMGHAYDVRTMAFSHDSSAFLSASKDSVKIWNHPSLSCVRTFPCTDALSGAFVTGDRHCLVGDKNGNVTLYDIAPSETLETLKAHDGPVWSLSITPDHKTVVTGSADKTIKFWDFQLVSHEESKRLSLAHTRTLELNDEVLCAKVSPDHKYIVAGLLDNTAKVHFVDTFKFYLSMYGHNLPVLCMDISSDSTLLITGSADRNVKIWGMDFGDCHRSLFAHEDSVTCVQFVPNTHLFFSAGKDAKVKQWDADKFERIFVLDGHHDEIWAMSISYNGIVLATASHDKSIRVWEKSDEIVVVGEEEEIEREKEDEKLLTENDDVVPGNVEMESGLASRKTMETVQAAERITEAVEICRGELSKEFDEIKHPLIVSYQSSSLAFFVADVIRRIPASDLEKALIMVPFSYVLEVLTYLAECLEHNYEIELCGRCVTFLLKIHHAFAISSFPTELIDRLRSTSKSTICEARDVIGFNLAALKFLQLELEEKEQVQLFTDISKTQKKRKKRRHAALVSTLK